MTQNPPFNPVAIFAVTASSLLAWSAIRRHDDLAQSYAMASQELGEIASLKWGSVNEEELSNLVEMGEESISREHTMWCAKRETAPARATGKFSNAD